MIRKVSPGMTSRIPPTYPAGPPERQPKYSYPAPPPPHRCTVTLVTPSGTVKYLNAQVSAATQYATSERTLPGYGTIGVVLPVPVNDGDGVGVIDTVSPSVADGVCVALTLAEAMGATCTASTSSCSSSAPMVATSGAWRRFRQRILWRIIPLEMGDQGKCGCVRVPRMGCPGEGGREDARGRGLRG